MATYNAGIVTAYGAAVQGGYTGTYEEFCAQQANYANTVVAVEATAAHCDEVADHCDDVLESIPQDYTNLNNEVTDLKSAIKYIYSDNDIKENIIHNGYSIAEQFGVFPVGGYKTYDYIIKDMTVFELEISVFGSSLFRLGFKNSDEFNEGSSTALANTIYIENTNSYIFSNSNNYKHIYIAVEESGHVVLRKRTYKDVILDRIGTMVTPEMFGAVGDGNSDDTDKIIACINYAKNNKKVVLMNGTYLTSYTILLSGSDLIIEGNSIIKYTGNTFAFDIRGLINSNIRIHRIEALLGNGLRFQPQTLQDFNQYVNLYIDDIIALISCVYIQKLAGVGWSNEIKFYDTRFESHNEDNSVGLNLDIQNGCSLKLINPSFEGIHTGIKAHTPSTSVPVILEIVNPRFAESFTYFLDTEGKVQATIMSNNMWDKSVFNLSNISVISIHGVVYNEDDEMFYGHAFYKGGEWNYSF